MASDGSDTNPADDAGDGSRILTVTPRDRDAMIRTVLGEAGNQDDLGQAAVAHVIMNRTIDGGYGGSSPTAVVLAPGQFEPNAGGLYPANSSSPQYQSAGRIVDAVLSGSIPDPTNGATMFLNPGVTAARSGRVPSWAQGPGIQIGDHVFSGGRSSSPDGDAADAPDASAAIGRVLHGAAPSRPCRLAPAHLPAASATPRRAPRQASPPAPRTCRTMLSKR